MAPRLSHQSVAADGLHTLSSLSNIQMISAVALAIALYSASVLDLETVACFLELQEIKLDPKNIQKPLVDRRSSMDPAQSASEKPLTTMDDL